MKAAVQALVLLTAAFLLAGCASVRDTRFSRLLPQDLPQPHRIAILQPTVVPELQPENLTGEGSWYLRLLGGRGLVVTGEALDRDAGLALITTLTRSGQYERVFAVGSIADARRLGADRLLVWTIHDSRTIIRGANSRYPLVILLGPLMAQYWIPWLSLEARIDWEVEMRSLATGEVTFQRRLQRSYYRTVRYALPSYLVRKMLTFLRFEAMPEYVAEIMMLDTLGPEEMIDRRPSVSCARKPHRRRAAAGLE